MPFSIPLNIRAAKATVVKVESVARRAHRHFIKMLIFLGVQESEAEKMKSRDFFNRLRNFDAAFEEAIDKERENRSKK
jgi:hypothetical protein